MSKEEYGMWFCQQGSCLLCFLDQSRFAKPDAVMRFSPQACQGLCLLPRTSRTRAYSIGPSFSLQTDEFICRNNITVRRAPARLSFPLITISPLLSSFPPSILVVGSHSHTVASARMSSPAMFRQSASRVLLRSLTKTSQPANAFYPKCANSSFSNSVRRSNSLLRTHAKPLALSTFRQPTSLIRHASSGAPGTFQRPEKEEKFATEELKPEPGIVSTTSSTHPVLGEVGQKDQEEDVDMMAGMRHDIVSFFGKKQSHWSTLISQIESYQRHIQPGCRA